MRLAQSQPLSNLLQPISIFWREADPPNHHDYKVDSDQQVVNKELSLNFWNQIFTVPSLEMDRACTGVPRS